MCKGLWLIAGLVSQGCGRKDQSDVGGRVVGLRVCRGRWVCQGSATIVWQRMGLACAWGARGGLNVRGARLWWSLGLAGLGWY